MFSSVLRFTLSFRSVIIVSMVVRLMSPLSYFNLFGLVFVIYLGVRMLKIYLAYFLFFSCLLVLELLGCSLHVVFISPDLWNYFSVVIVFLLVLWLFFLCL